ncbi:hypothetical protein J4573_48070 [Actinomadura barringtoniae]|uniref:Uncharacterized protein n=1 Tax=Actinomadura barringtoniae TaxID=1427535 RepID=A0A939PLC5_9ACTN|nr:hypothetical protein [Actinomadura barringtoniae]MBO2454916.1 hypothetical protein [Actinomadura barringtoniae]
MKAFALLIAALVLLLCAPSTASAADCVKLQGAAASLINGGRLCRNLRHEITAEHPDLGRAFRKPVRGGASHKSRPAHHTPTKPAKPVKAAPRQPKPQPRPVQHRPVQHNPAPDTPAPTKTIVTTPAAKATPAAAPAAEDPTPGIWPTVIAVVLLLLAFALHQQMTRPLPALPRPARSPKPPTPLRSAEELARPSGLGVVGPGANGFMRAMLVDLLSRDAKVVLSRNELNRMFEGAFDDGLIQSLAPRLHVCDLLEEAVEHLELDMLMAEAEQANPDLSPTRGRDVPTYWISTPGQDDDVVVPLVTRGTVGLVFGEWHHGRTCTVDSSGAVTCTDDETTLVAPSLTPDDALAQLRSYACF